jgi:hypothetical protein
MDHHTFCGGEISTWIEQGSSIHLKAVAGSDPVELTAAEARHLANVLVEFADKIDAADRG